MADDDTADAKAPKYKGNRSATPTILQMEAVECGAASLAMVLAGYGLWEPLESLRVECGVSRDGSKASNLVKAARRYGLQAKGFMVRGDGVFEQGRMPAIVFWTFNHFLVLEGVRGNTVYLNDPAFGPRKIDREEFFRGYSGIILTFEPGPEFKPGGKPPGMIANLMRRIRGSYDVLGLAIFASLMLVLPGIILPAGLKAFVDAVMVKNMTHWILPLAIGLALAAILNTVLTWLQQAYLRRIQNKLAITSASEVFWHLLRLPVVYFTQRQVGDVASRVDACSRVAQLLAGPLSTNMVGALLLGFYAAVMAAISVPLIAVVIALSLLNVVAIKLVQRKRKDLNSRLLNRRARMNGVSISGLQAIETLKATGTEHDFFTKWAGEHANVVEAQQSLGVFSFGLDAAPNLLNQLMLASVLGVGGFMIMEGNLTLGGLVAFQTLLPRFTGPIQQLVGFSSQFQEIKGDLTRIDDALRFEPDRLTSGITAETKPVAESGQARRLTGQLELRNIHFRYGPRDPMLIEGFHLSLRPGARVALVGGSGSGKSTIAKLIVGLYAPTDGEILFDGRRLEDIPREVFTESVAYVDQDVYLFEGTVRENIAMWDPSLSQEQVRQAAIDACTHDVIAARPGAYNSYVAEGGNNFSGGQRQRIEIARALVRDPRLIVLDEATAALDPLTEELIDQNLRRRGATCVIIAHRLSTIRDADEIIVLDRGQVTERGTHDELMAAAGRYAQLVKMG